MRKTAKGRKNKRTRKFRQTRKQKGGGLNNFFRKKTIIPEPEPEPEKKLTDAEIDEDQLKRQIIAIDQMRLDNPTMDIADIYAKLKNEQSFDMLRRYQKDYRDVNLDLNTQIITYEEPDDRQGMRDSTTNKVNYRKGSRGRYDAIRSYPGLLLPLSDEQIEEIKDRQGEYIQLSELDPNTNGGQKRRTNFKKKTRRGKRTTRR